MNDETQIPHDSILDRQGPVNGGRSVTVKSVLFGLLGIGLVSGLAGYIELRIPFAPPLVGSHLPAGPFVYVFLLALLWNWLWSRRVPALVLTPRELVVVLGMTLIACFPPTAGLFRHFQRQLMLPWYYLSAGGQTEWEKFGTLGYIPAKLFPQPAPQVQGALVTLDDTVYRGFFQGLARGNQFLGLTQVPWQAWIGPLLYWGPLLMLLSVCVMAMALLVHTQWVHHEQLSYPLAQVFSSLVHRKSGKGIPDLFRTRLFWWGFSPLFILYALEYLHQWFPSYVPGMSALLPHLKHWYVPWGNLFPVLWQSDALWYLCSQTLFFSVIGAAYFVASEISLTMGLSQLLLVLTGVVVCSTTGTPLARNEVGMMRGGAYIGYALILLYTGRSYYLATLRQAFRIGAVNPGQRAPVLAARLLLVSFAGFVALLTVMGLDWLVALLFGLLLMVLFLVFTRIICETGVPFMQAHWWPSSFMVALLGPSAVGPGPMVLIYYFSTILVQDPRESLMPYVATSLKMADDAKVKLTWIFWVLIAAVAVALAVGFISTSWTMYNFGGITDQSYASQTVPTAYLNEATRKISELNDTGLLKVSSAASGLAKIRLIAPAPADLVCIASGLVAVFAFSFLRFRFSRFPLHPVLFLVWGIYATSSVWASFLVGWGIKSLVVRFGGGRVYQDLKPLFVGLIAGELVMVGAAILVNLLYYWITGKLPGVDFRVLVG